MHLSGIAQHRTQLTAPTKRGMAPRRTAFERAEWPSLPHYYHFPVYCCKRKRQSRSRHALNILLAIIPYSYRGLSCAHCYDFGAIWTSGNVCCRRIQLARVSDRLLCYDLPICCHRIRHRNLPVRKQTAFGSLEGKVEMGTRREGLINHKVNFMSPMALQCYIR